MVNTHVSLFFFCACFSYTDGSLFDPHIIPKVGPFFEGWYNRITDLTSGDSFGVLFGHVVPKNGTNSSDPLALGSILYRSCVNSTCVLTSCDSAFDITSVSVSVNGHPIEVNPDMESPSNFLWTANSSTSSLVFAQIGNATLIHFKCNEVSFDANFGSPRPWGSDGEGPAAWLDYLPFLPLHWFVFSLRSPVYQYRFEDTNKGIVNIGRHAVAHMEKNWGNSFPAAWVWSEGVSSNVDGVSYALSGGLVGLGPVTLTSFLIGYRNPEKNIALNFRPGNSMVKFEYNGCLGELNMTANTALYQLHLQIYANPATFSNCLLGPMSTGFRPVCTESYDALARITVYKRKWWFWWSKRVVDTQEICMSALEFGGQYTCNHSCSAHTN